MKKNGDSEVWKIGDSEVCKIKKWQKPIENCEKADERRWLNRRQTCSSRRQHRRAQKRQQWLHRSAQHRRSSGTYVGRKVLTYNKLKRHSPLYILMPVNLNALALCLRCWQRFRLPYAHGCVREMTAASASSAWHQCRRKLQRTRLSCPEQSLDILPQLWTAKLSKTSKNNKNQKKQRRGNRTFG